jgi:hypothetical protein
LPGGFVITFKVATLPAIEVFQEEEPRGLLGIVQLGRAAGLFPENVVDVLEGLFEHRVMLIQKDLLSDFFVSSS